MDATDENSVTSRKGSLNGAEMTSFIVSYEEVRRCQIAKNRTCMRECGLLQAVEEL
jgi:hypothetical protein